jgi:CDP-paratose 2-epimerase
MRILITGICGFVGSTLADTWLKAAQNITIIGIDNLSRPGSETNLSLLRGKGVELVHGDIRMASDLECLPPVDWVVDAAAVTCVTAGVDGRTSSRQLVEHNLLGTVNLLEYCKRHSAGFILLSTSRVYNLARLASLELQETGGVFRPDAGRPLPAGLTAAGVSESFSTDPPLSLYGSSKRASEILALEYGETFNFPVWINRCGLMAGAGQFGRADQGVLSYWIHAWANRLPLQYTGFGGKGGQVRDVFHPRDIVPLLQKQTTARTGDYVRVVNLSGGLSNTISLSELSSWCTARFGSHQVSENPATHPFDVPWLVLDNSLAARQWDWQPQTPLHAILEEIALQAEQNPHWPESSGAPA